MRIPFHSVDPAAAQALILDGRGWSNKDRNSFYDKLGEEELVRRLGSWSPVVRERAAMALARREAILGGGSSGAALWGVRKLAQQLDRSARIVTVFPDSGTRYLSTIFNDQWMKERGFL